MVVQYSWKESIPIPICTLLLLPSYCLWHLSGPLLSQFRLLEGFSCHYKASREPWSESRGKGETCAWEEGCKSRAAPFGSKWAAVHLALWNWVVSHNSSILDLPCFPPSTPICSLLWFLAVSFAALNCFASLGYLWFGLPRTLLKVRFCHVTCGEDERRDIIFTKLRCVLSWWVKTDFMLLPSVSL